MTLRLFKCLHLNAQGFERPRSSEISKASRPIIYRSGAYLLRVNSFECGHLNRRGEDFCFYSGWFEQVLEINIFTLIMSYVEQYFKEISFQIQSIELSEYEGMIDIYRIEDKNSSFTTFFRWRGDLRFYSTEAWSVL